MQQPKLVVDVGEPLVELPARRVETKLRLTRELLRRIEPLPVGLERREVLLQLRALVTEKLVLQLRLPRSIVPSDGRDLRDELATLRVIRIREDRLLARGDVDLGLKHLVREHHRDHDRRDRERRRDDDEE